MADDDSKEKSDCIAECETRCIDTILANTNRIIQPRIGRGDCVILGRHASSMIMVDVMH